MRRTASEVIRELEMRVARLERQSTPNKEVMNDFLAMDGRRLPTNVGVWEFRFTHHSTKVGEWHSDLGLPLIEVYISRGMFKFIQLGKEIASAGRGYDGDADQNRMALILGTKIAISKSAR